MNDFLDWLFGRDDEPSDAEPVHGNRPGWPPEVEMTDDFYAFTRLMDELDMFVGLDEDEKAELAVGVYEAMQPDLRTNDPAVS